MTDKYNAYIEAARALALVSGEVLRRHFRTPLAPERKEDASPVTLADREAEDAMREFLRRHHPEHGILGEEGGSSGLDAEYVWVLDPLDGTKAFMAGIPTFTTLISLLHQGKPVLGIAHQPVTRELWIGVEGQKTTLNGHSVSTRQCVSLDQALLSTTSPYLFDEADGASFQKVRGACRYTVFGADGYAYAALASGGADLVVEAGLKPYDFCALIPIIQGAGGLITDWQGQPLDVRNTSAKVLAAGDGRTHRAAMQLLG